MTSIVFTTSNLPNWTRLSPFLFFSSSPIFPLSCSRSFSLSCQGRLASRLELGSPVGSTSDPLSSFCLIQHTEDLSTMRAEPAEVIAKRRLMNRALKFDGQGFSTHYQVLPFGQGRPSFELVTSRIWSCAQPPC